MFSWIYHFLLFGSEWWFAGLSIFLFVWTLWSLHVWCLFVLADTLLHPSLLSVPWQMRLLLHRGSLLWLTVGLGQWETQTRLWWKQMVGNELCISFPLLVLLSRQYLLLRSPGWPIPHLPGPTSQLLVIGKPCICHLSDGLFFLDTVMPSLFVLFSFLGCSYCS